MEGNWNPLRGKAQPLSLWAKIFCASAVLVSTVFCAGQSIAAGEALAAAATPTPEKYCPTEKYDAVTVQGKYLGWQLPHSPDGTITVRLRDSHVPLHIIASETRARSLFGHNFNADVEVTYDFIQIYSKEAKMCLRHYVLKTGKIIDEQKTTKFYH